MKKLSFDELKDLVIADPDKAEAYRIAVIEDFIDGLPEEKQDYARRFQWKLDGELRKIKNPIARMNMIGGTMWDSFLEMNNMLGDATAENGLNSKLLDLCPEKDI
jgi:hypothetical protein